MQVTSRIELKYPCLKENLTRIKNILIAHPAWKFDEHCFNQKAYWVASQYWDTPSLINYHDSQTGVLKKSKLRLRSYATDQNHDRGFQTLKAEIKHREGRVCYKAVQTLNSAILLKNNTNASCQDHFGQDLWHYYRKNTPSYHNQILHPMVTVLYKRLSFVHVNLKSRITLDYNIIPLSPELFLNAFDHKVSTHASLCVLELKDCILDHAEIYKIISLSESKKQKFSKYNLSIERIKGFS